MGTIRLPDILVIGCGVLQQEEILRNLHELYEQTRSLLFHFSLSTPPPIEPLVERLIKMNEAEIQIISREWKKFFIENFVQATEH